jgi:hypothetical protein
MPQRASKRVRLRCGNQNTDPGHLCGWLGKYRVCAERPHGAAKQKNKIPSPHASHRISCHLKDRAHFSKLLRVFDQFVSDTPRHRVA